MVKTRLGILWIGICLLGCGLLFQGCGSKCTCDYGLLFNSVREKRDIPLIPEGWLTPGRVICKSIKLFNPEGFDGRLSHRWKLIRFHEGAWDSEIDSYSKHLPGGGYDSLQVVSDVAEVRYRHYRRSPHSSNYISRDSAERWMDSKGL
jgi:hypothetical protein